jgi:hypothetical protein
LHNFFGYTGQHFDLKRDAVVAEADSPASGVGFRMKIADEDIGSGFRHAR